MMLLNYDFFLSQGLHAGVDSTIENNTERESEEVILTLFNSDTEEDNFSGFSVQ